MADKDSATQIDVIPILTSGRARGLLWGFIGTAAFSFTVPLTRVAVAGGGFSPLFVGSGRAVVAAVIAAVALVATRQRLPRRDEWLRLCLVAGGAVLGFPLLTSFALTHTPASHGAVVIALLPAATAVVAVVRARERPRLPFWIASALGGAAAITFAVVHAGGVGALTWADLLLVAAVIVCAVAYAEGGLLARRLGSWQTIAWALLLAAPVMSTLTAIAAIAHPPVASPTEWGAFAYLGVVSMFLGFVAWYRGLGIGPIATVSQVQLAQPVMSILWAVLLLGESLTWGTAIGGAVVVGCALVAVRSRNRPARTG